MTTKPLLVYLYGPPAAGKLTIAEHLAERTGIRLFHNHLTVNAIDPVFPFGTDAFTEVLHRLRLDVFATSAQHGIDVIFTNNSAWAGESGRADFVGFSERAAASVAANGGRVLFVQVMASRSSLEERVGAASRLAHGKLVDVHRLRELLAKHDPNPLHLDDLRIDTSVVSPYIAAERIAAEINERKRL